MRKKSCVTPGVWTHRRVQVQGAFLALLLATAWFNTGFTGCSYLRIGPVRLLCPVGFIELGFSSRSIALDLLPGFILFLAVVILLGRVYCSWVCPASFIAAQSAKAATALAPERVIRSVEQLAQKTRSSSHRVWQADQRDALAIVCGLFLGIFLAQYPAWSTVCPVGVLSRGIISLIRHNVVRADLMLLILPVLGGMFHLRGWIALCPLGACHTAASTLNTTMRVKAATDCNQCGRCARACPVGLTFDAVSKRFEDAVCLKCLRCNEVCPKQKNKKATV